MANGFAFHQDEVLRFALFRPPFERGSGRLNAIQTENSSALQQSLIAAWNAGDTQALDALNKAADSTQAYFKDGDVWLSSKLSAVSDAIQASQWPQQDELKDLTVVVTKVFGVPPAAIVATADFLGDVTRLENSLLFATYYPPYRASKPLSLLTTLLRVTNVIQVIKEPVASGTSKAFSSAPSFTRAVMMQLPIVPPPTIQASFKRKLVASPRRQQSAVPNKRTVDPDAIVALRNKLANLRPDQYYAPPTPNDPWTQVFGSVAESALTTPEKALLVELGLDFRAMNVQQLIGALDNAHALETLVPIGGRPDIISTGTTVVHKNTGNPEELMKVASTTQSPVFRPVGIADLLVVQQHIVSYTGGEVAHIDNAAKGEARVREHTRKDTTETETTVETETTTEEERSTQTTDRMEVKREVDRIIKDEASLKAGASLSASYGPAVEFKTYVDGTTSSSREEAQKQGTTYSRETIQRAVSKVAERVLERRKTTTRLELTEFNRIERKDTGSNVSAIFQWQSKIYQSQVYNYGRRVIYDIIVPEPAASFIFALGQGADNRPINLVKPQPFDVEPNALQPYNYQQYVVRYQAANVTPPPEPVRYIVKTFTDSQTGPNQSKPYADKLEVPASYEAVYGRVSITLAVWTANPNPTVDVFFGNSTWRRVNSGYWTSPGLSLDYRTGEVATLATAINTPAYSIGFDGMCKLSDAGLAAWRTRAHSEILAAYLSQLSNYESKLEQYTGTVMQNLFGRSPDENREIEKVEIKKTVTRLFWGKEIDFGSVDKPSNAFPTIDDKKLSEEGRVIRFFEQAFEWDQMQYTFYPYYWGKRDTWLDKILNRDQDPLFRNFLRSGAARVVLSVRPGFEELVAHFFLTGEVWQGGDLPQISDPSYVPILQEIREAQGQTNATVYGDPWTFTVPTTLVMLEENNKLPRWEKQNGEWVQVE